MPTGGGKGEGSTGKVGAAAGSGRGYHASKSGSEGDGDATYGDGDGGEEEAEAVMKEKLKRDNLMSDAQRLTTEFASGRLAAPHFFGAMMVSEHCCCVVAVGTSRLPGTSFREHSVVCPVPPYPVPIQAVDATPVVTEVTRPRGRATQNEQGPPYIPDLSLL